MAGFVAGKVVASKRADYAAGDLFGASLDFCTLQVGGRAGGRARRQTDRLQSRRRGRTAMPRGMCGLTRCCCCCYCCCDRRALCDLGQILTKEKAAKTMMWKVRASSNRPLLC